MINNLPQCDEKLNNSDLIWKSLSFRKTDISQPLFIKDLEFGIPWRCLSNKNWSSAVLNVSKFETKLYLTCYVWAIPDHAFQK